MSAATNGKHRSAVPVEDPADLASPRKLEKTFEEVRAAPARRAGRESSVGSCSSARRGSSPCSASCPVRECAHFETFATRRGAAEESLDSAADMVSLSRSTRIGAGQMRGSDTLFQHLFEEKWCLRRPPRALRFSQANPANGRADASKAGAPSSSGAGEGDGKGTEPHAPKAPGVLSSLFSPVYNFFAGNRDGERHAPHLRALEAPFAQDEIEVADEDAEPKVRMAPACQCRAMARRRARRPIDLAVVRLS